MKGLFDYLKEENGGIELTDEEKDKVLELIDLPKNDEEYYIDTYGSPISYNGIRTLKKANAILEYNEHQKTELKKIHEDYFYFRKHYCKILTRQGIGRPEPREYQKRAEEALIKGEDLIIFFPRQAGKCSHKDTYINVNKDDIYMRITVESFHNIELITKYSKNKKKSITNQMSIDRMLNTKEFQDFNIKITPKQKEKLNELFEVVNNLSFYFEPKWIKKFLIGGLEDNYILRTIKLLEYNSRKDVKPSNNSIEKSILLYKVATLTPIKKLPNFSNKKNMKLSESKEYNKKFVEVIETNRWNVETEDGYKPIISSNKTIKYKVYKVLLEDNMFLECADNHILINENYQEIFAKISKNSYIRTKKGIKKVIDVIETDVFENMYDLTIDSEEKTYYTNDILSHNTVTIATYLLWRAITSKDANIGIAANVLSLAKEVLDKIKKILVELPMWMQPGIVSWNKTYIEFDNNTRIMTAASNGDAFRGFTIKYLYVDEAAFIRTSDYNDFEDAVMPAMSAIPDAQAIFSSTANGLNFFYHKVQGARNNTNGFGIVEADWREVPRYRKDGSILPPEEFKKMQIAKNGELYFSQNYSNNFLGSSKTLISADALKNITPIPEDEIINDKLFNGLRIFKEALPGHNYIIAVDPKIDGNDNAGVQVVDVTNIPFEQVASANIKESYMVMPGRIYDLGTYYNNALVVIENNIDVSIVDALYYQYEYEGEIFRQRQGNQKSWKGKLGFRTTTKSKRIILSSLKKFIEEELLIINDKVTLEELFNFIEKSNGTYSAEDGFKDDMVMALALIFAPFMNIRNWDDYKGFVTFLEQKSKEEKQEQEAFAKLMDLGFSSDVTDEDLENIDLPNYIEYKEY